MYYFPMERGKRVYVNCHISTIYFSTMSHFFLFQILEILLQPRRFSPPILIQSFVVTWHWPAIFSLDIFFNLSSFCRLPAIFILIGEFRKEFLVTRYGASFSCTRMNRNIMDQAAPSISEVAEKTVASANMPSTSWKKAQLESFLRKCGGRVAEQYDELERQIFLGCSCRPEEDSAGEDYYNWLNCFLPAVSRKGYLNHRT